MFSKVTRNLSEAFPTSLSGQVGRGVGYPNTTIGTPQKGVFSLLWFMLLTITRPGSNIRISCALGLRRVFGWEGARCDETPSDLTFDPYMFYLQTPNEIQIDRENEYYTIEERRERLRQLMAEERAMYQAELHLHGLALGKDVH